MRSVDVVIVGAGLAGCATARALAGTGREVVLLEQFDAGHTRGSSHGTSRIFRFSYDDPHFVRMAMDALPLWRELEAACGKTLVETRGGFDIGADLSAHVAALRTCGAEYELLDAAGARERWEAIAWPTDAQVLFQPDAGICRADRALPAFLQAATTAGVEFRQNVVVEAIETDESRALVTSSAEIYSAATAVVTAGAWARALLAPVGIDLPVVPTRETVAYFETPSGLPVPSLVEWAEPPFYALEAPGIGLKAGIHHAGPVTDPNDDGVPDDAAVATIAEWVARRYPDAAPDPVTAETCIYTNTADEYFIIERHGPIVVGSPCSGHGFKFGPLTGRLIADLAMDVPGPSIDAGTRRPA